MPDSNGYRRKLDRLTVLEASASTSRSNKHNDLQCQNCKERYTLFPKKGDDNNLQCANCGALFPIRSIQHGRGLAVPAMQQSPALPQSETRDRKRKPKAIHREKSELEESLIDKGYQIIDTDNR